MNSACPFGKLWGDGTGRTPWTYAAQQETYTANKQPAVHVPTRAAWKACAYLAVAQSVAPFVCESAPAYFVARPLRRASSWRGSCSARWNLAETPHRLGGTATQPPAAKPRRPSLSYQQPSTKLSTVIYLYIILLYYITLQFHKIITDSFVWINF